MLKKIAKYRLKSSMNTRGYRLKKLEPYRPFDDTGLSETVGLPDVSRHPGLNPPRGYRLKKLGPRRLVVHMGLSETVSLLDVL